MTNEDINTDFLNDFNYLEKDNYKWENEQSTRDGFRNVFFGINKNNKEDFIYVKQIKISPLTYKKILTEIYFLIFLKNQDYFVDLYDLIISKDKEKIFLLFKGNNVDIFTLINSEKKNYLLNKNLIKWIIYQIAFGLYFLHYNKIIHNDIKLSNILIDNEGGVVICDLGSANYENEKNFEFSFSYSAPEFLNGNTFSNEKFDMWSLGVIMLELFFKKNGIFKVESQNINNEVQLNFILSKFGINGNISKEEIDKLINDENNLKYIIFDNVQIKTIGDPDAIDLIKHLLTLNPKKRYTAKQVLKSKYLEEVLSQGFNKLNLKKIEEPIHYNILSGDINRDLFLKIFDSLNTKFKKINKSK